MANAAGLDAFKENQEITVVDASKKVKIGIIGTGWIAESHISSYKKMPDVEIVAMADLIPGKAEAFAKKFEIENCRFYENDEALLAAEKDLDGVSICTYNGTHASCAIHALNAGVNVTACPELVSLLATYDENLSQMFENSGYVAGGESIVQISDLDYQNLITCENWRKN